MNDILRYHIIPLSPLEFLCVSKTMREAALSVIDNYGSPSTPFDSKCIQIINYLVLYDRRCDIAKFTSRFWSDRNNRLNWSVACQVSLRFLTDNEIWQLYNLRDYLDETLLGTIICWAYT